MHFSFTVNYFYRRHGQIWRQQIFFIRKKMPKTNVSRKLIDRKMMGLLQFLNKKWRRQPTEAFWNNNNHFSAKIVWTPKCFLYKRWSHSGERIQFYLNQKNFHIVSIENVPKNPDKIRTKIVKKVRRIIDIWLKVEWPYRKLYRFADS